MRKCRAFASSAMAGGNRRWSRKRKAVAMLRAGSPSDVCACLTFALLATGAAVCSARHVDIEENQFQSFSYLREHPWRCGQSIRRLPFTKRAGF